MGRIQKLRDKVGMTDKKLIANGLPARGHVVEVRPTNIVMGIARKFQIVGLFASRSRTMNCIGDFVPNHETTHADRFSDDSEKERAVN